MKIGILGILALLFSLALTSNLYAQENIPVIRPTRITAKAILDGTQDGIPIQGEARIFETQMGLRIMIQFEQAPPGPHGIHIHEKGSCDDSGKAAGGHFNPDGTEHGFWPKDGPEKSHSGDMGNVMIRKAGKGRHQLPMRLLTLSDGKYSVAGLAIILHEKEDDFGQPTGNAGARIGCGLIQLD